MFGGNFEMELAQMEAAEGSEDLLGEGPENQKTNIKWVIHTNIIIYVLFGISIISFYVNEVSIFNLKESN